MKLDPKYFNTFLAVVAVLAALLIAFFTINSQQDKRAAFKKRMMQQDSLKTVFWPKLEQPDSLKITDFKDQYVLLQFWSDWSDEAVDEHHILTEIQQKNSGQLTVISAIVGLQKKEALAYVKKHNFPFRYVAGSQEFAAFGVPGLPAYLLYGHDQNLKYISLGSLTKVQSDSLKKVISHGG